MNKTSNDLASLEEHILLVGNSAPLLNGTKEKPSTVVSLCKHSVSKDSKGKQFKRNHTVHANDYDKRIHQNSVCSVCLMKCQSFYTYFCRSLMTQQNKQ